MFTKTVILASLVLGALAQATPSSVASVDSVGSAEAPIQSQATYGLNKPTDTLPSQPKPEGVKAHRLGASSDLKEPKKVNVQLQFKQRPLPKTTSYRKFGKEGPLAFKKHEADFDALRAWKQYNNAKEDRLSKSRKHGYRKAHKSAHRHEDLFEDELDSDLDTEFDLERESDDEPRGSFKKHGRKSKSLDYGRTYESESSSGRKHRYGKHLHSKQWRKAKSHDRQPEDEYLFDELD